MGLSIETVRRFYASGRNYANYFLGVATTLGFVSASQSKTLTDSFNEIVNGVSQIVHGATSIWQVGVVVLGPVTGVILARFASNSASTASQMASVKAAANDPTDPEKAKAAQAAMLTAVTTTNGINVEGVIKAPPEVASAVPSAQVIAK